MKIGKIASVTEYRIREAFQNFPIFGISIVFKIGKILKLKKKFNLVSSKNVQYEKFL